MAAPYSTIAEFLNSSDWTESEKFVIKWQFGFLGDFHTALAKAIVQADESNLLRLALGFPKEVKGFVQWSQGDLGTRLRAAGLGI